MVDVIEKCLHVETTRLQPFGKGKRLITPIPQGQKRRSVEIAIKHIVKRKVVLLGGFDHISLQTNITLYNNTSLSQGDIPCHKNHIRIKNFVQIF